MKKQKLKKKELAVRIGRLVEQFSDLNNRLNRVSHDRINQGIQLDQLSKDSFGLQQRFEALQTQIEQVITQEEAQGRLLESLQLQATGSVPSEESEQAQRQTQASLSHLTRQLAALDEQQQGLRQALEGERQTVDHVANKTDDLRRDIADVLSHIRRLEESGSELLVSDSQHETQIRGLQNDIVELGRRLEQVPKDRESPQQEISQLLQESAQPLLHQIEDLREQITERGGQQKALEQRLLELANRIGEIGARVENQKRDRIHLDEVLENRLSRLEGLAADLEPVSDADEVQLAALDQKLDRVEQELASLLADKAATEQNYQSLDEKSSELAARLDALDGALHEQSARNSALNDLVTHLGSEIASNSHQVDERLGSTDLRLTQFIEQQAAQQDPLASVSTLIEEQKQRFEHTVELLKQEIRGLDSKLQSLDLDENEVSERLNSLSSDLHRQAGTREEMERALKATRDEIGRRIDLLQTRLGTAESLLAEQGETARDQLRQLAGLSEEMAEQSKYGVDLKLLTSALQNDAGSLKKSNELLGERLDQLQQSLQQGEEAQGRISQQMAALEQEQAEIREHNLLGMETLQERVQSALERMAEQSGFSQGLAQRLDDLETSLQEQFHNIDERYRKLIETESDQRERLELQEQSNHTLSGLITELRTEHQDLLEQTGEQKTFLEAMTSEYGKRQEESEQMVRRLGMLDSKVESVSSTGTYNSFAIGGLLVLLLLSALLGYNYLSNRIGGVERDFSLRLMKLNENYVTRNEIEQLGNRPEHDAMALEALVQEQQRLEQQFVQFEQQFAAAGEPAPDQAADSGRELAGEPQAGVSPPIDQRLQQRLDQMESLLDSLESALESDIEPLQKQGDVTPESQVEKTAETEQLTLTPEALKQEHRQVGTPPSSLEPWRALRESGGYTLQLIGVSTREAIDAFVENHGLDGELAFIQTSREGSDWYILLHGMHGSYREAKKALEGLPDALKSLKPWIRKMPKTGTINIL